MSRFCTVEGIDGSGTTTVSQELAQRFSKVIWTQEPTDSWLGRVTRESFEERDIHDLARFHLFMADRVVHANDFLKPYLEDDYSVICDRGPDSTRAYQKHTSGLSDGFIEENLSRTLEPDLTIWLDADVDTALERVEDKDAFENRELQEKVADTYAELHEQHDRIVRIDANQPLEDVIEEAVNVWS